MTADPGLPRQYRTVPNDHRSGDADLRHDQALLADPYVVGIVHQVVVFVSFSTHGVVDAAGVDGRVGADLDVIADDAAPDVLVFLVRAILKTVAKPSQP